MRVGEELGAAGAAAAAAATSGAAAGAVAAGATAGSVGAGACELCGSCGCCGSCDSAGFASSFASSFTSGFASSFTSGSAGACGNCADWSNKIVFSISAGVNRLASVPAARALLRTKGLEIALMSFSVSPSLPPSRIDNNVFAVLLSLAGRVSSGVSAAGGGFLFLADKFGVRTRVRYGEGNPRNWYTRFTEGML